MTVDLRDRSAQKDPFLLEAVAADSLLGEPAGDGPVALTCNCYGSCQGGLCSGTCCSMRVTALEI
jgi:hypothetical protein